MKKIIKKDKKNRINFLGSENKRVILKSISYNNILCKTIRLKSNFNLYTFFKQNLSKVCFVYKCLISSSKKSFYKNYNFSRLLLLKLIRENAIFGYVKH